MLTIMKQLAFHLTRLSINNDMFNITLVPPRLFRTIHYSKQYQPSFALKLRICVYQKAALVLGHRGADAGHQHDQEGPQCNQPGFYVQYPISLVYKTAVILQITSSVLSFETFLGQESLSFAPFCLVAFVEI